MARTVTDINKRDAEILLAALSLVKANGGEMKYSAIKEELPKSFKFTEKELSPRKTWKQFWYAVLCMVGGIELKKVGLVNIRKGMWSLTKDGEEAIALSPEDFYKLYHYRYLDIQKAKAIAGNSSNTESIEQETSQEVEFDIETLQEKAREQIRQYIVSRDPYQFQDMVAALFRAMGYFTPFVAPKGRDGGIDVIAYCDPLGVKKPHIKIQVKHYPTTPISVDVIRSLTGICKYNDEIGFVITSGSFTNEALRESRSLHNNIRLIDGDEFVELWIAYYNNMHEDDKALMPITPICYLNLNN
ncbi:MAG: restriction endonuclease [Lachnospiraceae bacterium]|nr:restriction endonuclease [Lachnospiraceae bacterium]